MRRHLLAALAVTKALQPHLAMLNACWTLVFIAGTLPIFRLIGRDEYSVGMPIGKEQQASLVAFAPHVLHITSPDMLGFSAVSWARAAGSCSVCSFHTQARIACLYTSCAHRWSARARA